MKIRKGFVSNSSSSSFILDGNKYTCVDVAKDMAHSYFLENEYGDIDQSKYDEYIEILDKLENKNTPIYLHMYDDEQIVKVDDKIYVDATRNTDWDLDCCEYGEEGEYYEKMEGIKWYFPECDNKILARFATWDEEMKIKTKYENQDFWRCDCNKKMRYVLFEPTMDMFCPACGKTPDGKKIAQFQREDKLNRILKDDC